MVENWLRTGLTTLGILIGVGSVVLLVSIGQGVKDDISRQIEGLGTNVVFIVPGKLDRNGQPNMMSTLGISTLTERDAATVSAVPGVEFAFPVMFVSGTVETDSGSFSTIVIAADSRIQSIGAQKVAQGRFFSPEDAARPACVIADEPKQEIFGSGPAVGKTLRIRDKPFEVVGVLEPLKPSLFAQGFTQSVIYLPYASARKSFPRGQVNRIFFRIGASEKPLPVIAKVKEALIRNHGGKEDFGVVTQEQLLGVVNRLLTIVQVLLAGISAISLVVAGIGIMNIMLVTVTERTKEIGLRKAVGARRSDIFSQFLTEAIVIACTGGAAGAAGAVGVCYVLGRVSPLVPVVTWWSLALAFGVCLAVGLVFGVAPAARAARQDPIEALRHE